MKIKLEMDGKSFEYEREPMPPERFSALCRLAGGAIAGAVLLGAMRLDSLLTIVGAVVALILYGLYKTVML